MPSEFVPRLNWRQVTWEGLQQGDVVHYIGLDSEYRAYYFSKWATAGKERLAILENGHKVHRRRHATKQVMYFEYAERKLFKAISLQ